MKNVRVQRWAIMLEEYGCQIEYKSGKSNVVADALSRLEIKGAPRDLNVDVIDSTKPGILEDNNLDIKSNCKSFNGKTSRCLSICKFGLRRFLTFLLRSMYVGDHTNYP